MKKAILITLTALLLVGCGSKSTTLNGKAQGYGGELSVKVAVEGDGKVTQIAVEAPKETPAIGGAAAPKVAQSIVDKQSLKVDTISGATVTSNAVIEAVRSALKSGNVTMDGM